MRTVVRLFLMVLALTFMAVPASAQTATIKIIVPSTAGGGADTLARLLGDQIGRKQGQTIVVENRPGASNTIGTEVVARAAPDGNTVLVTTPEFVINAHLKKLNYDPLTSFESVCYLVKSPQLIVVNATSPYRTLTNLLDGARTKPGELTIASAGPASSPHIAIEALKHAAGVSMNYIPYQGSTPAVNALLGEHVTAVMASYPNVAELVNTGKLRALATGAAARIEPLPNVRPLPNLGSRVSKPTYGSAGGSGKNTEWSAVTACRLVHRRAQRPRGHAKACRSRTVSRRHLRNCSRGIHAKTV
jgi:tripartite-type tricarboxylate transporter receptor subunit TctC